MCQLSTGALSKRLAPIEFIQTHRFNGFAKVDADGESKIAINANVYASLYRFAVMTQYTYYTEDFVMGEWQFGFLSRVQEVGKDARRLLEELASGTLYDEHGVAPTDLTNLQRWQASGLASRAERFIVGHEIAHIALALAPSSPIQRGWATARCSTLVDEGIQPHEVYRAIATGSIDVVSDISKLPVSSKESVARHWAEEIAADAIALDLSVSTEGDEYGRRRAVLGAELDLAIGAMLEAYLKTVHNKDVSVDTHPPCYWRLGILREYVTAHGWSKKQFEWED